jgi:hypothetical protein
VRAGRRDLGLASLAAGLSGSGAELITARVVQGNAARPLVLGELWNGTSWTAEPVPVPTGV